MSNQTAFDQAGEVGLSFVGTFVGTFVTGGQGLRLRPIFSEKKREGDKLSIEQLIGPAKERGLLWYRSVPCLI